MSNSISRRKFFGTAGAVIAGTALSPAVAAAEDKEKKKIPRVKEYRTLGRTGFKVSDVGYGAGGVKDAAVIHYAIDCGVNYFDTAESYQGGNSEKLIGEVMQKHDRKKFFITSKIHIKEDETKERIIERFGKCLERLQTDYLDCFYMHSVNDLKFIDHKAWHEATDQLKADGRLRFKGISSHGSRFGMDGEPFEKTLCAAAEDGRFDVMLLVHSFMNREAGEKVLAACKKNNVGATAMKTSPGVLKAVPYDPKNPSEEQQSLIDRLKKRGWTDEQIENRLVMSAKTSAENEVKTKPFIEKYGIRTEEELRKLSIQWVLQNRDMHTVCVTFNEFAQIDRIVPISGMKLTSTERRFLEEYAAVYGNQYCRHGCTECVDVCPKGVPVSTIMRYAYYFERPDEKLAMAKYAGLGGPDGLDCTGCSAPCRSACPHGIDVASQLLEAHRRLSTG